MRIVVATKEDHARLSQISRSHKAGNGFTSHMFSPDSAYEKGWIRKAVLDDGTIVGFTCVRHKVRTPKTSLYYIIVDKEYRSGGIVNGKPIVGVGQALLNDLMEQCPHPCIELSCLKDNTPALKFYEKNGFQTIDGDALKGTGYHLEKKWVR